MILNKLSHVTLFKKLNGSLFTFMIIDQQLCHSLVGQSFSGFLYKFGIITNVDFFFVLFFKSIQKLRFPSSTYIVNRPLLSELRSMAVFDEISGVQADCGRACTRTIVLKALNCACTRASVYSKFFFSNFSYFLVYALAFRNIRSRECSCLIAQYALLSLLISLPICKLA